jgi:hypothetical protein
MILWGLTAISTKSQWFQANLEVVTDSMSGKSSR